MTFKYTLHFHFPTRFLARVKYDKAEKTFPMLASSAEGVASIRFRAPSPEPHPLFTLGVSCKTLHVLDEYIDPIIDDELQFIIGIRTKDFQKSYLAGTSSSGIKGGPV